MKLQRFESGILLPSCDKKSAEKNAYLFGSLVELSALSTRFFT
jgi:hypothetical protein